MLEVVSMWAPLQSLVLTTTSCKVSDAWPPWNKQELTSGVSNLPRSVHSSSTVPGDLVNYLWSQSPSGHDGINVEVAPANIWHAGWANLVWERQFVAQGQDGKVIVNGLSIVSGMVGDLADWHFQIMSIILTLVMISYPDGKLGKGYQKGEKIRMHKIFF